MRLLVLGGTRFVGRHLAADALGRGHEVTLFHRGVSAPALFPDARHVIGDRTSGLGGLEGGTWDAVVDTSGYLPGVVRRAARALAGRAGTYAFVSSISAYAEFDPAGTDESAPLATLPGGAGETLSAETYGGLKARCEQEVRDAVGARALIVRPGLIVGPHDTTERFPYWPRRMARAGEVLAPAPADAPVQLVDARDLAGWMLDLLERGGRGTFNATGPGRPLSFGEALAACREAAGSAASITWVDEAFLLARGVRPWTGLPLWVPAAEQASHRVVVRRALDAGLRFRPLLETARDTLAWDLATPAAARPRGAGLGGGGPLDPAEEARLLSAWADSRGGGGAPPARPEPRPAG